ncbi:hypothetical protein KSP40_PGU021819 [Platanthera guangdongensis]|uniref:Uncharacterized protein n=1 Tax=Platanthera guangdongensis TaxID=2320717 RepID=A0ABR2M9F5_9ASPA
MQLVLTAMYLLAFPRIIASIFRSPCAENLKEILNPASSITLPKVISDYLTNMGAWIPNIKPGKATIEYLTKIQASICFLGGVLLSILATSSSMLDHNLRRVNENFSVGFTSVLIIVGLIIELRRSYQAYNVMPSLRKVLWRYDV